MTGNEIPGPKYHKRIRLEGHDYGRPGTICSVTIAVRDRRPVFADPATAACAVDVLLAHADKAAVPIYGYCVMPDHVHLILGPSGHCDIMTFVGQYKNLAQRAAWTHGVEGAFWQKSFWDHFLRAEEQVERVVEYVLSNPVRKGLVEGWRTIRSLAPWYLIQARRAGDKPPRYSGSLVFDPGAEGGGQAPALHDRSEAYPGSIDAKSWWKLS